MASKVIDVDLGWDKIKKEVSKLNNTSVNIGLFGDGQDPKSNLAYRGTIQEYGTPEGIKVTEKMRNFLGAMGFHLKKETTKITIPPRPFTRNAFDSNRNKFAMYVQQRFALFIDNKISISVFLNSIGTLHIDHIKRSITGGKWKENHSFTIEQKGSTRPLVDNAEMLNGVKYKIEEGRGED